MAVASGMAGAVVLAAGRPISKMAFGRQRPPPIWVFTPLLPFCSSSPPPSSSSSSPARARRLVLYSKPGCCLCDGLKEKLQVVFSLSGPHSLHDVELQVRDITTNPEWERTYQYEIPVLAKVLPDGTEEILPRLSPRLGVELIQKKMAAALTQ